MKQRALKLNPKTIFIYKSAKRGQNFESTDPTTATMMTTITGTGIFNK